MSRLIDADILKKEGWSLCRTYQKDEKTMVYEVKDISEINTAQPERKKGEWIEVAVTDGYDIEGVKTWVSVMQCDQCGFIVNAVEGHMAQYNFCPNCGADMRGEKE